MSQVEAVRWLRSEYLKRRKRNPTYSQRAFARDLGISSGRLSEYLSAKRRISEKMAWKLASRSRQKMEDIEEVFSRINPSSETVFQEIDSDRFALVSQWYYFAILSLINTSDFKNDDMWISKRLGLNVQTVRDAIDRLLRLGLVKLLDGTLVRTAGSFSTSDNVPCEALQNSHRQVLEKSIASLSDVSHDLRDVVSMTMAIDMNRLPEAKELIRKFKKELSGYLEVGDPTEVYEFTCALVPLTKLR